MPRGDADMWQWRRALVFHGDGIVGRGAFNRAVLVRGNSVGVWQWSNHPRHADTSVVGSRYLGVWGFRSMLTPEASFWLKVSYST